jgi:hypothetical protein
VVVLLRVRHQLTSIKAGSSSTLLVDEATAVAWSATQPAMIENGDALSLLAPQPIADPPPHVRERAVAQALAELPQRRSDLDAFANRRADLLLADHRRVREAAHSRGSYTIKPLLPADVIGVFVLLPRVV